MANIMTSTFSSSTTCIHNFHNSKSTAALCNVVHRRQSMAMCILNQQELTKSMCYITFSPLYLNQPRGSGHKSVLKPICAAGSGLQTSVGDKSESQIKLKKVDIAVESQEANLIKIRVDLPADETQKVFDVILSKLARSAPPTPGFRAQKGGKTSKIPKELLLNILGKDMVMKFVIREIITSAVTDYVEKENLAVKEKTSKTTQTEDELKQSFSPGSAFGFNAILELETEENETTTSNS